MCWLSSGGPCEGGGSHRDGGDDRDGDGGSF